MSTIQACLQEHKLDLVIGSIRLIRVSEKTVLLLLIHKKILEITITGVGSNNDENFIERVQSVLFKYLMPYTHKAHLQEQKTYRCHNF